MRAVPNGSRVGFGKCSDSWRAEIVCMTRTLRDLGVWADAAALVTTVLAACLLGAVRRRRCYRMEGLQGVEVDGACLGWGGESCTELGLLRSRLGRLA